MREERLAHWQVTICPSLAANTSNHLLDARPFPSAALTNIPPTVARRDASKSSRPSLPSPTSIPLPCTTPGPQSASAACFCYAKGQRNRLPIKRRQERDEGGGGGITVPHLVEGRLPTTNLTPQHASDIICSRAVVVAPPG